MMLFLLCILNILCPPLAVGLHRGLTEAFLINVVLTILAYIPGVIHGFYILLQDDPEK